jgi:hypothetical protein
MKKLKVMRNSPVKDGRDPLPNHGSSMLERPPLFGGGRLDAHLLHGY